MATGIQGFLRQNGYKLTRLVLETEGDYSVRDSEWNYSDIPHLNYIHTRVEGFKLTAGRNHISSVFLQRVGPIVLPAAVTILHDTPELHEYVMTILNLIIHVQTLHGQTQNRHAKTTTTYQFAYKGFLGWIVALLARAATEQNYRILMAEDIPMRMQRGNLRKIGARFKLDSEPLIGFSDTEDIYSNNLDLSCTTGHYKNSRYQLKPGINILHDMNHNLSIVTSPDKVVVYPRVCPHEGADLTILASKQISCKSKILQCPWHGRAIKSIAELSLSSRESRQVSFCGMTLIVSVQDTNEGLMLSITPKSP